MIDADLIKEREKVFDDFRQISKEISKTKDEIQILKNQIHDKSVIWNDLNKKHTYLNRLINIMITEDCDPVEAKLKYDEELETARNTPNEGEAMAGISSGYQDTVRFKTRYGVI